MDEARLEQLERAIAVLRAFNADHPRLTVSEVAQLTDTTRASARRILLTFPSLGLMRSDGRHLPGGVPAGLSTDKAAAAMKAIRPVTATDACRRDIARDLLADLRRLDRQVKDTEAEMRDALAATQR